MSGSLRQSIGPKRNAMVQRYKAAKQLVDQRIPTELAECEEHLCQLNVSKSKLTDSIASFETLDQRWLQLIDGLDDALKKTDEEQHYEKFAANATDGYLTIVEFCRDTQRDLEGRITRTEKQITKLTVSIPTPKQNAAENSRCVRAKLPKLTLPSFEGKDSLEWNQFWTIFSANVDVQDITKTEKFAYLIAQLHGTALETVKGLSISDANYDVAVSLLKKRFQRAKGTIVRMLYSQLKQLPCSQKSITAIRQTYNDTEALLRQLEETDEDLNSNTSLAVDILSKYPPTTIRELSHRYSVSDDSTVSEIRNAIQKYVADAENLSESFSRLRSVTSCTETKPKATFDTDLTSHPGSTKPVSALSAADKKTATDSSSTQIPPGLCYFCDGNHYNSDCPTYPSATERIAQLRKRNRCERCGRGHHVAKDCKRSIRCIHCRTSNHHYTALCKRQFPSSTTTVSATSKSKIKGSEKGKAVEAKDTAKTSRAEAMDTAKTSSDVGHSSVTMLNVAEKSVLLTARTVVINPTTGKQRKARLIFDSASHQSYIISSLADELEVESTEDEFLKVSIFGTKRTLTMNSRVVSIDIKQRDGAVKTITAHTTPFITHYSVLPEGLSKDDQTLIKSMKYALAEDFEEGHNSVDILIGSDYFWDFITGSRISTASGLLLIPSTLGLLLAGRYPNSNIASEGADDETVTMLCLTARQSQFSHVTALTAVSPNGKAVSPDIDEFWQLERIGISDDPTVSDDDKALSQFNSSVYQENGRYHVKWPWIEERKAALPVNYELALGRLRSLLKRLKTDTSDLVQKYQDVIDAQCASQIIEKVTSDEIVNPRHTIHYLPHHPVIKLSSATTKVRIVYDASSKCRKHSYSLNECIYRGPVMLPHLCDVLIRFRCYPYVILADVEKAFLQMALQAPDRDVTRFLWINDPEKLDTENNVAVYRFCRVPFGVIASPFLLGATISHHLRKYFDVEETTMHSQCNPGQKSIATSAQRIARDIYVDNVTCGADSECQAIELMSDMTTLFQAASMNLQEFCSNSDTVLDRLSREMRTKDRIVKFLGIMWDSKQDILRLAKRDISKPATTKRIMLHIIASIFDPLGLFQPVTLPAKFILQRLWKMNLDWDDPVPESLCQEWNCILQNVEEIFEYTIPRFVGSATSNQLMTIIAFSDASAKGYAAAVYLRVPESRPEGSKWNVNLVFSKSRLSPSSKSITLPRLELLGVLIGIKAAVFVRKALDEAATIAIHLFTDAKVVLHWLQTKRLLAKFVANRIRTIQSVSNVTFRHVASEDNPADFCTRGKSASELRVSNLWWHGPSFLQGEIDEWPTTTYQPIASEILQEIANEYRPSEVRHTCTFATNATIRDRGCNARFGIDIERFSTLRKLLRTTVIVGKFVKFFIWSKLSEHTQQRYPCLQSVLGGFSDDTRCSADDLLTAKNCWVKAVQQSHFSDVINALRTDQKHELIAQLGLRYDEDGILRSHSRYEYAELPNDVKFPKLLPKSDPLTTLIIEDIHARLLHSSIPHTLSEIRREFWIPQGRAAVRRILHRCVTCRKYRGPPYSLPKMPPWPREKLVRQAPFQSTGLDYMGPISIKTGDIIRKAWICLYTCLVVRAVHLEVICDCTSKEFLDCLIRFISRRGTPKLIISDNAPQFRTTKTVLDRVWHQILTHSSVATYCADQGIEWRFTIELAPWQGGFYERLIQIVKKTMRTAIGRRLLSWTEFVTLTAEVEAVVNTRPITYVYSDNRSRYAVIKPIEFLSDLPVRYPNIDKVDVSNADLGEAGKLLVGYWKYRQKRRRQVWDLWFSEYLLSLRERGKTKHRGHRSEVQRVPVLDEVIVLRDDDVPRGAWKLARVKKLICSHDGKIRAVELQLPNGSILRRTLNFCYPLEIPSPDESNEDGDTEAVDQMNESHSFPDEHDAEPAQHSDDEDDFEGFTPEEVQRTVEAIQRQRATGPDVSAAGISALFAGKTTRVRRKDQSGLLPGLSVQQ